MPVNTSFIFITVTCIFLCLKSVECSNTSQSLKSSPELDKVKLADSGRIKSKKYQLTPSYKTRNGSTKLNVTVEKLEPTKPNFRMSKKVTKKLWPKTQKADLRQNSNSETSTRFTQMNMMQMNDEVSTCVYQIDNIKLDYSKIKGLEMKMATPVNQQFENPDNGDINEYLSPYTVLCVKSTNPHLASVVDYGLNPSHHERRLGPAVDRQKIKEDMTRIASKFANANVTVEVIGRTLEYNDIVLMKISQLNNVSARFRADDKKYVDDTGEKKIIFIVHGLSVMGIHSLQCLFVTTRFIGFVSHYLKHLDLYDIFLIPLANPDGFGYKKFLWNKNMSPQEACPGVALDRNFDIAWNTTRAVSSCSQQYPGPAPFSEPETRAIRDTLHRYTHKIIAYIHVHAGSSRPNVFKGDAVLYPKGYTDVQMDDDKYIDLKGEIDEAMRKASFQVYSVTVDTLYNWYGKVSGSSVDYASTVYGIPYAMEFVMQLYEDNRRTVFSQIVVDEVWNRVIDVAMKSIWNSFHSNEI